jgi:hypothetical protein
MGRGPSLLQVHVNTIGLTCEVQIRPPARSLKVSYFIASINMKGK